MLLLSPWVGKHHYVSTRSSKDIAQDRCLEASWKISLVRTITALQVIRENKQVLINYKSKACCEENEKHIMSIGAHLDVLWNVCFSAAEGHSSNKDAQRKTGLHLWIQRDWFFFFFSSAGLAPALHDVGSDAPQLLSFDLTMLYLLSVLCRLPVSAVSPEAHREMLHFKQDALWILYLKENSSALKRCDFFGEWSVCFPQNNEKEWLTAGNPSSWLPYVRSLLIYIFRFSPMV